MIAEVIEAYMGHPASILFDAFLTCSLISSDTETLFNDTEVNEPTQTSLSELQVNIIASIMLNPIFVLDWGCCVHS